MTRLEAHNKAVRNLETAVDVLEEAVRLLTAARTIGSVETGSGLYRITMEQAAARVEGLLQSAEEAECEDCGKALAACNCEWLKQEVK